MTKPLSLSAKDLEARPLDRSLKLYVPDNESFLTVVKLLQASQYFRR